MSSDGHSETETPRLGTPTAWPESGLWDTNLSDPFWGDVVPLADPPIHRHTPAIVTPETE